MTFTRRRTPDSRMEMTPMIDVTFLLLIFFMCTLRFRTLDEKLSATLPRDAGVAPTPAERVEEIRIRLDASPDERVLYRVGPFRTTDADRAAERVASLFRAAPERRVTVDPRDGVRHGEVVGLLDRLVGRRLSEVTIAAARER